MSTPVIESTSKVLLDAVASPILIFRDGHIVFANRAACAALGGDQPVVIGSPLERWIHPDDWTKLRAWDQPGEQTTAETLRFLRADQTVMTAEFTTNPMRFEGQSAWVGIVAKSPDETPADPAIRYRFDVMTQHMDEVVTEMDGATRLTYVSPSVSAILGYAPEEMIGHLSQEFIPAEARDETMQSMRALLREGSISQAQYPVLHKDGHWVWLETSGASIRGVDNEPLRIVTVSRDITARKQAEDILHRTRERFRTLAEHMNDFIVEISPEGRMLYISPSCKRILGYDADALMQNWSLETVHPDDLTRISQLMQAALLDHGDRYAEFRIRHQNGNFIWVEAAGSVIRQESGEIRSLMAVCRDVTTRKQAEEILQSSEQRYRMLAEQMNDIIVETDPHGKITYVTASCLPVIGYTQEELLNTVSFDWIHPDDRSRIMQVFNEALIDGQARVVPFRYQHKMGHYVWLEASGSIVEDTSNHHQRVQMVCRDVTARKLAEDALREAESLMRQVMELVPVDIYIYDVVEHCNIFHNRKTNLGYHLQDLADGSDLYYGNFVHPDDRPVFEEKSQRLAEARDGEIIDSEHRMWHAAGQWRWIAFHDMVFKRDADGKPTQFLGYYQDVTERREVEAALRLSEEKLRTIADNMHDMVSMVDANLIFTHASPAHQIILGYAPDDLIGHAVMDYVHPDDLELVVRSAQSAYQRRDSDMIEFRFRHADGYYIWLETTGRVITDAAGKVTGAVFTSRDISERRWMQRAMVEQERLVTALQKEQELGGLMQRMMTRLSHELRTPLAVISSSTDLLEYYGQRMNETQRGERLHQIRSQVRALTGMLDNMSLVVKGLTFSSDFSASPYDLERLCRQVIEDVPKLLKASQTIDLRLNGPTNHVPADEHLMRLTLTHLLSNALKYSAADSVVEIEVNATAEAIELKVIDHGVGILPDERERIFEPFFRGTNINEAPGLGIGLSIVEKAIVSHHGSIDLSSEPGRGTRVTVKLPLKVD